jgi:hypothetical protein
LLGLLFDLKWEAVYSSELPAGAIFLKILLFIIAEVSTTKPQNLISS